MNEVTFRRFSLFFCLCSLGFAQHTPRKCADVPIKTTDGKVIHISQYHGKVVMLEMMLTDCGPCLDTLQFMGRLKAEMGARGLVTIGVALAQEETVVKAFADRYRLPFPIAELDREPAIKFLDLNETAHPVVPYLMFVDWMGNVRFQYAGNDPIFNSGEKNIRAVADGLLRQAAEKTGPQYETRPATPGK